MHGSSAEARSEQLGLDTPDQRSTEREHEGRGQGVLPPSETTPECTLGGSQDGGGVDDQVKSGKSKGEPLCSGRLQSVLTTSSEGERLG